VYHQGVDAGGLAYKSISAHLKTSRHQDAVKMNQSRHREEAIHDANTQHHNAAILSPVQLPSVNEIMGTRTAEQPMHSGMRSNRMSFFDDLLLGSEGLEPSAGDFQDRNSGADFGVADEDSDVENPWMINSLARSMGFDFSLNGCEMFGDDIDDSVPAGGDPSGTFFTLYYWHILINWNR